MTWREFPLAPEPYGDLASFAGLQEATRAGLDFGREAVWTYGPLGFLRSPLLIFTPLFALAVLYEACLRLALCWLLIRALRRHLPLVVAVLVAWLVAAAMHEEIEVALIAVWGLETLRAAPGSWLRRSAPVVAGLGVALFALVKGNVGLAAAGVAAIVVWQTRGDGWRRLAVFGATATGTLIVLLAATRQGAPMDYLETSASMGADYANSLTLEWSGLAWHYPAAVAVGVIVLAAALVETAHGRAPRWPVLAVLACVGFLLWKEGFVRHDTYHAKVFFASALALAATFSWGRFGVAPLLASVALLWAIVPAAAKMSPGDVLRPAERFSVLRQDVRILVDVGARERKLRASRVRAAFMAPIPESALAQLRHRTVAILPHELLQPWIYGLRWRPVPVLQVYATFNRSLDEINRRFFASARAPERILRGNDSGHPAWDGRLDSPAAMVEVFCRYRHVVLAGRWEVLARRASSRCGPARPLATVRVRGTRRVRVPAPHHPGSAVAMRVYGAEVRGLERARQFLFRAHQRRILLRGRWGTLRPFTASQPLLVRAPAGTDFPGRFSLSVQTPQVAVGVDGDPQRELRYEFVEIPLRAGR